MLKKLIRFGSQKLALLDEHTLEVLRKSMASIGVKIIGMVASLLLSVFLGRTLGADGVGIINLSNRIITLLSVIGLFGMQQVVIKKVSVYRKKKYYQAIKDLMKSVFWFNGMITLILSILMILITPWLANEVFNEPELTYPLTVVLTMLTPQVFSRIYSSALVGYKKIWQSNLVNQSLSVIITTIMLFFIWWIEGELSVYIVAIGYAVGWLIVTFTVGIYWNSIFKHKIKGIFNRKYLYNSYPFFMVSVSSVVFINADAIILGLFANAKEVGLYTVAARIALMASFFLQITNSSVSPKIAALYAGGQLDELERMIQKVTKALFFLGLFVLLIFIFLGKYILGIWGEEFEGGYWILVILGVGQFINLSTGAVGLLLMMTKYEKIHGQITMLFSVFNIIFLVVLVLFFNAIGAAIGSAFTIIGLNLTTLFFVQKKVGITTLSFRKK
ncbi:MAG: oligosaccharide flippase family protein [Zunongwangia sp.]|uniref:oligosaccharide flippase family protein n=1 Tax=Zunongwangia sp. TaxID=1965325 RepID=UPI003242858A